jgi:hypothetical protein
VKVDDPKAMLALWSDQRGLPPPAYVASRVASGGVEVVGSITLDGGRYLRASHQSSQESEAELEVSRELFVRVQDTVGPIAFPVAVPRRRETAPERFARRADRADERQALEREARRRGAYTCIMAYYERGRWAAKGLWLVGGESTTAGPFDAPTRELAEARAVAGLLRLCMGDGAGARDGSPALN